MVNCSVKFCLSRSHSPRRLRKGTHANGKVAFHEFPANLELREKWISFVAVDNWRPTDWSRVCSLHFKPDDYEDGLKIRKLKRTAVPCIVTRQCKLKLRQSTKVTMPKGPSLIECQFEEKCDGRSMNSESQSDAEQIDVLARENTFLKQQLNDTRHHCFQTEFKESFDVALQPYIAQLLKVYDDACNDEPEARILLHQLLHYKQCSKSLL